jgi:L-glutamine-phosphate cytidylyltransferase
MKIIFIAAGSSTRLGEYTAEIPKGLLKINKNSIIGAQIELFKKNKNNEIIIVTGPNKEKFNFKNVVYLNDSDHEKHDVLGSLMTARDYMNDEIITTYSDIIFDEKIMESINNFSGDIGIAVDLDWEKNYEDRDQHPKSEADNVIIKNGKIIQIKKNILSCENSEQIGEFLGLMKLSKNGADLFLRKYLELEKSHKGKFHNASSLEKAYLTDLFQELINSGIDISPIYIDGEWCEIDTPQDLEKARKIFDRN